MIGPNRFSANPIDRAVTGDEPGLSFDADRRTGSPGAAEPRERKPVSGAKRVGARPSSWGAAPTSTPPAAASSPAEADQVVALDGLAASRCTAGRRGAVGQSCGLAPRPWCPKAWRVGAEWLGPPGCSTASPAPPPSQQHRTGPRPPSQTRPAQPPAPAPPPITQPSPTGSSPRARGAPQRTRPGSRSHPRAPRDGNGGVQGAPQRQRSAVPTPVLRPYTARRGTQRASTGSRRVRDRHPRGCRPSCRENKNFPRYWGPLIGEMFVGGLRALWRNGCPFGSERPSTISGALGVRGRPVGGRAALSHRGRPSARGTTFGGTVASTPSLRGLRTRNTFSGRPCPLHQMSLRGRADSRGQYGRDSAGAVSGSAAAGANGLLSVGPALVVSKWGWFRAAGATVGQRRPAAGRCRWPRAGLVRGRIRGRWRAACAACSVGAAPSWAGFAPRADGRAAGTEGRGSGRLPVVAVFSLPHRAARALSGCAAASFGPGFGFVFSGLFTERFGWQRTFLVSAPSMLTVLTTGSSSTGRVSRPALRPPH